MRMSRTGALPGSVSNPATINAAGSSPASNCPLRRRSAADGLDLEVVEGSGGPLAEEPFAEGYVHGELGCVRVLERERVEQAEQPVADPEAVDLAAQLLPGAQRGVNGGVRNAL